MKKVLILLTVLLTATPAFADETTNKETSLTLEYENYFNSNDFYFIVKLEMRYFFKSWLGGFIYSQVENDWYQGILGLKLKFLNIEMSLGGGIEKSKIPLRMLSSIYSKQERFYTFIVFEYGDSGYYYQGEFVIHIIPHLLSAGFKWQRHAGLGPIVEVDIPFSPFSLWGGPMWDPEHNMKLGGLAGLRLNI